jgi:homoserine O-acetyltransferase
MELYDLSQGRGDLQAAARSITARTLLVGISSDILFEEDEIRRFAKLLPKGEYRTLFADHGHDSFLVDVEELAEIIGPFVERVIPVQEEVIL